MNRILLFLIFGFPCFSFAQNDWAPQGATWTYSFIGTGYYGYVEINYVGDTIINSVNCKKLHKLWTGTENFPVSIFSADRGFEYTYEDSGIVYLWYNNHFDTLYNFNSSVGDSWRMAKQPWSNGSCDSNKIVTVIDTGSVIVNSINLKFKILEFDYGDFWLQTYGSNYVDTIIEKIGFVNYYMFPYDRCNEIWDHNEGGQFRCYYDDNFPVYKPIYPNDCQFVVGINELKIFGLEIFPNPTIDFLSLKNSNPNLNYKILDNTGRTILFGKAEKEINVQMLSPGYYRVVFEDEVNRAFIKL